MPALFENFVATWLAVVATVTLKGSGYSEYASMCRVHLIPYFGDSPVEAITTERIQRYISDKVRSGLSPRTVVNHVHVLRRIMTYALTSGILTADPTSGVVMPRVERAEMSYLTPDGIRRLIEATPRSWRLLVAMAALTGLRRGEQLALRFSDIDVEHRTISVKRSMRYGRTSSPKTEASIGVVPLPKSLVPMLEERRRKVVDPDGLVFCRSDGRPLPDSLPNRVLACALMAAELPRIRWHDLRHSWAVAHLQAGTDIPTLQRLGRWASADSLLQTYAHVLPASGGEAVRRVDALIHS